MTIDTFLNRELWWLEGNRPYLEDAQDPATPLLARLKALAVISANLDEFFIGRIPALKQLIRGGDPAAAPPNDRPTALTIRAVAKQVRELTDAQQRCFVHEIQPRLARDGVDVHVSLDGPDAARHGPWCLPRGMDRHAAIAIR